MQLLVIFRTRERTDTADPEVQRALIEGINKLMDYQKEGKILDASLKSEHTPRYTYAIFNVESLDELDSLLWDIPAVPYLHIRKFTLLPHF